MTVHFEDNFRSESPRSIQLMGDFSARRLLRGQGGFYRIAGKRLLDIMMVFMMTPIALVVIGVAAACILAGGGRPFYRQARVGRDHKIFLVLKLQTMVPDAEEVLKRHLRENPPARAEWADKQKLLDDPRITRIGAILRRTSLDELPQLWNVLKGDMSLVGPRPMMLTQKRLYPGERYYALRPGITGLWQVKARNDSSFVVRADFDDAYENRMSLKTDLGILVATVGVVLRCTGH